MFCFSFDYALVGITLLISKNSAFVGDPVLGVGRNITLYLFALSAVTFLVAYSFKLKIDTDELEWS